MLESAAARLAEAGIENSRGEARLLLAHVLGVRRDAVLAEPSLTPDQQKTFDALLTRRAAREPYAYITGKREFWTLTLDVGPGVLIPRPETETLIEAALAKTKTAKRIADLGTGSGALLLAALSEYPHATGIGFESSPLAHAYASRNAARIAPNRAEIRLADWNTAAGPFDLIFCNPPYITSLDIGSLEPDVRLFEPRAALDGGPDGLACYRALSTLLPRILAPGAFAILELGAGQKPRFAGLNYVRTVPDLVGIGRAMVLRAPE